MNLNRLALKNLKRHRVRTALTVVGIAISVMTLFSILAFNSGYDRALSDEVSASGTHLYVSREGCPLQAAAMILHGGDMPELLDEGMLPQVASVQGVKGTGGYLIGTAIAGGRADFFYGITKGVLGLKPGWKLEGAWFDGPDDVILGGGIAEDLGATSGGTTRIDSVDRSFKVSGVLEKTGGEEDNFIFLPVATAQQIFDHPGKLTAIGIRLEDIDDVDEVKANIEKIPGAYVITSEDMSQTVLDIIGGTKSVMFTILVIVLIVSCLAIFNTVLMATFERRQEFGYLRCIGAGRKHVFRLVLLETAWLCAAGMVAGIAVALAASTLIDSLIRRLLPYVPAGRLVRPELLTLAISVGVVLVMGLVAGLYPGYKASSVPPMEAIRNE